jgi:hypothetical protein
MPFEFLGPHAILAKLETIGFADIAFFTEGNDGAASCLAMVPPFLDMDFQAKPKRPMA